MTTFIRNAQVLCASRAFAPYRADVELSEGKIAAIHAPGAPVPAGAEILDANGRVLLPGFVQAHLHLAQVLFRGLGEGFRLLDWLAKRVLPLEAAHDEQTLFAGARLGIAELLLGGCTALLDMGSVTHPDAIFTAADEMGIRLTGAKILMDTGADTPEALREPTDVALRGMEDVYRRWHGFAADRLRVAIAPRFLLSCTDALMRQSLAAAARWGLTWHTHVAEQRAEIAYVNETTGKTSLELIDDWGGADARLALAHMIHVPAADRERAKAWRMGVLHCPRANTRLGSGVCPVPDWRARQHPVGIGSDGSACNNRLDMFEEMRAAAALQELQVGPGVLRGRDLLEMATIGGARAIGIDDVAGTVEVGKRADLMLLDLGAIGALSGGEPADTIVHNADARNIARVWVDGRLLVADGRLTQSDEAGILTSARTAIEVLKARALQ